MMRNRIIIYLLGVVFTGVLSTSCLDKGGQEISVAFQPAVVKGTSSKVLLLKNAEVRSASLDSNPDLVDGVCGLVDFVWDSSNPENSSDSGYYYVATSLTFTKLDKYNPAEALSDTTGVYPNEKTVSTLYSKSVLIDNNLFVFTEHPRVFNSTDTELSYNNDFVPELNADGKRIYDLFLRFRGDTTQSTQKEIKYNVFDLSSFVNEKRTIEQENAKDTLYFRIQYLSAMTSDSVPVWNASQNFEMLLRE